MESPKFSSFIRQYVKLAIAAYISVLHVMILWSLMAQNRPSFKINLHNSEEIAFLFAYASISFLNGAVVLTLKGHGVSIISFNFEIDHLIVNIYFGLCLF